MNSVIKFGARIGFGLAVVTGALFFWGWQDPAQNPAPRLRAAAAWLQSDRGQLSRSKLSPRAPRKRDKFPLAKHSMKTTIGLTVSRSQSETIPIKP
jgi:hypothetical protein